MMIVVLDQDAVRGGVVVLWKEGKELGGGKKEWPWKVELALYHGQSSRTCNRVFKSRSGG